MKESQGKTVWLRDYRVPDYLIDETQLVFELHEEHTLVSSRLPMRRNPAAGQGRAPLVLDGVQLELLEVKLDGTTLSASAYEVEDEHLTLPSLRSVEESVALAGGGRYVLRRMNVHYSLRYLLRFLRIPLPVPRSLDVVLPIPAGAFELIWYNDAVSGSASRETAARPA